MRNVDSKIKSPQFDRYVYSFHRLFAATFSTASVKTGKSRNEQMFSGLPRKRTPICALMSTRLKLCPERKQLIERQRRGS
jgi:hypothetical protein